MPDEQREPTQARVEWRCSHCKEPLAGPNIMCGGKFTDTDHPPMAPGERVPASAPSEQREGEARVDLAERLEKIADRLDGYAERYPYELGGATLMDEAEAVREAASTIDHQTKALEAADELAKVAAFAPVTRTARVAYRSARATSTKEDG